jgi:hypothetical protein
MRHATRALAMAGILSLTLGPAAAFATSAERSTQNVVWTFDATNVVGTSSLVRTNSGVTATYHSGNLPAGQAVTMWFVVFNNPSACAAFPCGLADLLLNPAAEGDFLVGAGHVIGGSGTANFGGRLNVGDVSGSAFPEIGMPDRVLGLTDPWNAEVHLLLHSHGPKVPGPTLSQQLSSFTGGCTAFLGDAGLPGSGIADGPEDIPDAVGECSTIQASIHP